MPKPDKIITYRDCQTIALPQFAATTRRRMGRPGPMSAEIAAAPAVPAEVNHGRWLARCPYCAGAEMIDPADLRFFCCSCGMAAIGGVWLPVMMPSQAKAIEQALLRRPIAANRNWRPGETLAQLQAENRANGVT